MSELKTAPNPDRIPLGKLLAKLHRAMPSLTLEAIRSARYRARRAGLPDPHPYAIREAGVLCTLADLRIYNKIARIKGWPLVQDSEVEGGGAR